MVIEPNVITEPAGREETMAKKTVRTRNEKLRPNDQIYMEKGWRTVLRVRLGHTTSWVRVTYDLTTDGALMRDTKEVALMRNDYQDAVLSESPGDQEYPWVTIRYARGDEGLGYIVENDRGMHARFSDLKWAALMFKTLTDLPHNGDLPTREPQVTNP